MKLNVVFAGLSIAAGLAVFGCGGGGGGGNNNSAFEGTYIGTFTQTGSSLNNSGEFAINVSASGAITGRYIIKSPTPSTAAINTGNITVTSESGGMDTGTATLGSGTHSASGTLTLTGGVVSGTLTDSTDGYSFNFTGLNSTANGNAYAGYYNGTFTYNGTAGTPANTLAVIVDPTGNIIALAVNNVAPPTWNGLLTGTIVSGTGAATIYPPANITYTLQGPLTLSGSTLSGSLGQTVPLVVTIAPTLTKNT